MPEALWLAPIRETGAHFKAYSLASEVVSNIIFRSRVRYLASSGPEILHLLRRLGFTCSQLHFRRVISSSQGL